MTPSRPTLRGPDGTTAVVAPDAGGRLASLRIAGRERLVTEPGEDPRLDWGCYLMAPWAGRLAEARLPIGDTAHQLVADHGRHAIHGVALDAAWTVEAVTATRTVLSAALDPVRWPPGGHVREDISLGPGQASLRATVTAGSEPMPASLGWHPWFARPNRGDMTLRCDAARVLLTDDEVIPDGTSQPVHGHLDLREGPPLEQRRIDDCFTDVREPVVLSWPDLRLTIRSDVTTYVIYTPERGASVEPQTAWPNAPALAAAGVPGTGLVHLEPGESLSLATELTWSVTPAA